MVCPYLCVCVYLSIWLSQQPPAMNRRIALQLYSVLCCTLFHCISCMKFSNIHVFPITNFLMGQHSRLQEVDSHTSTSRPIQYTHTHAHTHQHAGRQAEKSLLAHFFSSLFLWGNKKRECVSERMRRVSTGVGCRCYEQLAFFFFQNPSGGSKCGEKHRRKETVGNHGGDTKSMRKQSRRSKEREGRKWGEIKVELMREVEGRDRRRDDRQGETEWDQKHREWEAEMSQALQTSPALTPHPHTAVRAETLHPQFWLKSDRK